MGVELIRKYEPVVLAAVSKLATSKLLLSSNTQWGCSEPVGVSKSLSIDISGLWRMSQERGIFLDTGEIMETACLRAHSLSHEISLY